jgi:hypothetical protein
MKALVKILKGTLGEVHPLVVDTDLCYRGADIVITPHNIATRVVRESLACGTPVVAGTGNPFTPFTADSRDAKAFGTAIDECWTWIRSIEKKEVVATSRRMAEREFGFKRAGEAAKAVYEKVIEENAPKWTKQGALDRKTYPSYDAYVKEQKSKLENGLPFDLEKYDTEYRKALKDRLEKLDGWGWRGLSVLCLGARTGAEVKAFVDLGCFAVGVDLNPGKENKYVVTGDFHKLQYADNSVDCAFTNCFDHVYRPRMFLGEVTRILRPNGSFIIELEGPKDKDSDKWASLHWNNLDDLCSLFAEFGLKLKEKSSFESMWFRNQLVFQVEKET